MLGEHGPGPVFFRNRERGFAESVVFGKAACGRRALPEDRGGILGYLDDLGCNDSIEPDEVSKHLVCLSILHEEEIVPEIILMVREEPGSR